MGDEINGYELLQPFATTGGGQCRWTFASKGGTEYFVKEFLRPTYPVNARGSRETQAKKLAECRNFEHRHIEMMKALQGVSSAHGNLVVAADFFRLGAKYYKVTVKVDVSASTTREIAALATTDLLMLSTALAHSVNVLHGVGIVHGDLKPANVLVKTTARGLPTAKLIDFDDAYKVGSPPTPAELVGDVVYYAPEVYGYVVDESDKRTAGAHLGTAADIFSMGIILCEYMTGQRPNGVTRDGAHVDSCGEALYLGGNVQLPEFAADRSKLTSLFSRLLSVDPSERPSAQEVVASLKELRRGRGLPETPRSGFTKELGEDGHKVEIKGTLARSRRSEEKESNSIVIRGKMAPKKPRTE